MRDKLRSPGSISTLIAAPPIDSESVAAGVSKWFAEVGLNSAAELEKHRAATIPTANLKLLKSIVAFFAHGAKPLAAFRPVSGEIRPPASIGLRATLLP